MPKPLAKQVARRVALDTALEMAETISNNEGGASSSTGNPTVGILNDSNYFLSSVPIANYWNISPVPREAAALDDYRWDMLMQGIGPENR